MADVTENKNVADAKQKNEGKSKRFWENSKCLVCQSKHFTETAWDSHAKTEAHLQKVKVNEFLNSVNMYDTATNTSLTLHSLTDECKEKMLGLECIHEFHDQMGSLSFWLCSVCYDVSVDCSELAKHLISNTHRLCYVGQFHQDQKPKASTVRELTSELDRLAKQIGEQQAQSVPEVLLLKIESADALNILGINDDGQLKETDLQKSDETFETISSNSNSPKTDEEVVTISLTPDLPYKIISSTENERIGYCDTCWHVLKLKADANNTFATLWNKHVQTVSHKKKKNFPYLDFRELLPDDKNVVSGDCCVVTDFESCKMSGKTMFFNKSILCGLDYILEYHQPNKQRIELCCLLCAEIIPATEYDLPKHATSESHAMEFMHKYYQDVVLEIEQSTPFKKKQMIDDLLRNLPENRGKIKIYAPFGLFNKSNPGEGREPTFDKQAKAPTNSISEEGNEDDEIQILEPAKKRFLSSAVRNDIKPTEEVLVVDEIRIDDKKPIKTKLSVKNDVKSEIEAKMAQSDTEILTTKSYQTVIKLNEVEKLVTECTEPIIGVKHLYIVCCASYSSSCITFFCYICQSWESSATLCNHLTGNGHMKAYMDRWYKMYSRNVEKYPKEASKIAVLKQYAKQIHKSEGVPKITHCLKYKVSVADLKFVWPELSKEIVADNTPVAPFLSSTTPPPGMDPSDVVTDTKVVQPPAALLQPVPPGTGPDDNRVSINRDPQMQPTPPGMHYVCNSLLKQPHYSQQISVDTSRSRTRKQTHDEMAWDEKAAIFLNKIGDAKGAEKVRNLMASEKAREKRSLEVSGSRSRHSRHGHSRSPSYSRRRRSRSTDRRQRRSPSPEYNRRSNRDRRDRSRSRHDRDFSSPALKGGYFNSSDFDSVKATMMDRGHLVGTQPEPTIIPNPLSPRDTQMLLSPTGVAPFQPNVPPPGYGVAPSYNIVNAQPVSPILSGQPVSPIDVSKPPPNIAKEEEVKKESVYGTEAALQQLLGGNSSESAEELLLKLLMEERQKQQEQEKQQQALLNLLKESLEQKPTAVYDYSHGGDIEKSKPVRPTAAVAPPPPQTAYNSRHLKNVYRGSDMSEQQTSSSARDDEMLVEEAWNVLQSRQEQHMSSNPTIYGSVQPISNYSTTQTNWPSVNESMITNPRTRKPVDQRLRGFDDPVVVPSSHRSARQREAASPVFPPLPGGNLEGYRQIQMAKANAVPRDTIESELHRFYEASRSRFNERNLSQPQGLEVVDMDISEDY